MSDSVEAGSSNGAMTFEAQFSVPSTHPSLAGHFPGQPVIPGVLLLDQVLDVIAGTKTGRVDIETVRFLAPILPDEVVDVVGYRTGAREFEFACKVAGRTVLRGKIRFPP